ncbi:MAG TPA: MFS transporter [Parafilimonas sp.]
MNLLPKKHLSDAEVERGLKMVIGDGLAAEAMTTLTGGAFLVAMALLMGASNFQIGLLAALPTFTNLFQLISIWLVRKYNNRRAIAVICALLARIPLVVVGIIAVTAKTQTSIEVLIIFLFFYYLFGSIAGPSWNAWMKDLVPEKILGAYFSKRTTLTQTLNVILSIFLALLIDYIKKDHPDYQLSIYAIMFIIAGCIGIAGAFILSKAPEPQSFFEKDNLFRLLKKPLKDSNFLRLLIFNSIWVFAINLATPFFTVYLLKDLNYPISYRIILGIISQLCGIFAVRSWGAFADRYSNKTIIALSAPIYIVCIIAWCFVGIYTHLYANIILLALIYIFTGIFTAGVNLSLTNIGLKLAPKEESIIYLSAKNIITAFFATIAPLIGGYLADYFTRRHLNISIQWASPGVNKVFRLLQLHGLNFLFLIGALFAFIAIEFLFQVKEQGEVEKDQVKRIMRSSFRNTLRDYFLIGHLVIWQEHLWAAIKRKWYEADRQKRA